MFSEEPIRTAEVIADQPSVLAVFDLNDFDRFMEMHASLAVKYQNYFAAIKAGRDAQRQGILFKDDRKRLALIAHNEMKGALSGFVKMHSEDVGPFPLVATGTTGMMLYQEAGLVLGRKVASGPLGGDQAIGTLISTDNICGVIFFRDPLSAHPHHADIEALGRLCDVYQIPFATNPGTAGAILKYLLESDSRGCIGNQVLENCRNQQLQVLNKDAV